MDSKQQAFEFEPAVENPAEGRSQFTFFLRRKGLVISMLLAGLALGYAYYRRTDPVYQSSAQILIMQERAKLPIEGVEVSMASDEIHTMLIQSEDVIRNAVEIGQLRELTSLRDKTSPTSTIRGGLTVETAATSWGEGAFLLDISYESRDPADCPKILTAVIAAYQSFLNEINQHVSTELIQFIGEAKDQVDTELQGAKARYQAFKETSPPLFTDSTGLNAHEAHALRLHARRQDIELENNRLQAQIDSLEADSENGRREILNLIIAQLGRAGGSLRLGQDQRVEGESPTPKELIPLHMEELDRVNRYGPEHPKVKQVRERIALIEKLLEPGEAMDYAELYFDSLRKTIEINDLEIEQLTKTYNLELAEAKELEKQELIDESLRSEIENKSRLLDAVLGSLEEISLLRDQKGSTVRPVNRPSKAGQVWPDVGRVMLISSVLGLFAGLGLAFVVDEADRRFHSPDEIRGDFGIPVIGHIPDIDDALSELDGDVRHDLCTVDAPDGPIAEAYRTVRTAIYFSSRGGGQRVLQIASPHPSEGKTTLAANLAVSVAQSGKRVLLVDGDFRRPRCHSVFEADNEVGVSTVLTGNAEWTDALQQTEVENLQLMSCGARPGNPAELLASGRFGELLDFLREKYDLIIVDSPPILVVTDALDIAARVDAVLMVLKLNKSSRQAGRRALDALDEIGTKVLGVVVNGVGGAHGYGSNGFTYYKYKFGSAYGYGRGYSYKYGDSNGYGRGDAEFQAESRHGGNGHGGGDV